MTLDIVAPQLFLEKEQDDCCSRGNCSGVDMELGTNKSHFSLKLPWVGFKTEHPFTELGGIQVCLQLFLVPCLTDDSLY